MKLNHKIEITGIIGCMCFSLIALMYGMNLSAQPQITAYTEIGTNCISDRFFIKTAGLAAYQFRNNNIEAGLQTDLKSNNEKIASGYEVSLSRRFFIRNYPFEVQSFFILTPFSNLFHATNLGFLTKMRRNHFAIQAGTNFRTYVYHNSRINEYESSTTSKIRETWNLMYSFSYYLKPVDHWWNIGLSITDIDHFNINQETNPFWILGTSCKLRSNLRLYGETLYKSAGAFNLHVNYFGFYFRTGLIWNINLKT